MKRFRMPPLWVYAVSLLTFRASFKPPALPRLRWHSLPVLASLTILWAMLIWLVIIHVPIGREEADLPLPAADFSSKLKDDKAAGRGGFAGNAPAIFSSDEAENWSSPLLAKPSLAPPVLLPVGVEEPTLDSPFDVAPGGAPMFGNHKIGPLQVLVFGWFFGFPSLDAFADEKASQGETASRLEKIERNLNDLKLLGDGLAEKMKTVHDDIATLKTDVARLQQEGARIQTAKKPVVEDPPKPAETASNELLERFKNLEKRLEGIEKRFEGLDQAGLALQAHTRDINNLKTEVGRLQNDIVRLQDVQKTQERIAKAPPATGRVHLINAWNTPQTVIIDGQSYRLAPGQVMTLTKPVGPFSYEVLGVQAPVVRQIIADDTFNIRIGLQ